MVLSSRTSNLKSWRNYGGGRSSGGIASFGNRKVQKRGVNPMKFNPHSESRRRILGLLSQKWLIKELKIAKMESDHRLPANGEKPKSKEEEEDDEIAEEEEAGSSSRSSG